MFKIMIAKLKNAKTKILQKSSSVFERTLLGLNVEGTKLHFQHLEHQKAERKRIGQLKRKFTNHKKKHPLSPKDGSDIALLPLRIYRIMSKKFIKTDTTISF